MEIQGISPTHRAHQESPVSTKSFRDESVYASRLVSEKKGLLSRSLEALASIPAKIWSGITWIFETIFFCFTFGPKIPGNTPKERLENERARFLEVREEFMNKKADKGFERNNFKTWWRDVFDNLPQVMKVRIVKESLRDNARAKGFTTPASQDGYITEAYANSSRREKTLKYVRDLEMQSTSKGAWDPIDDTQVPRFLQDILAQLKASIDKK